MEDLPIYNCTILQFSLQSIAIVRDTKSKRKILQEIILKNCIMIRLNVSYVEKLSRLAKGTSNMLVNPVKHAINNNKQSIPLPSNNTDQEHPRKTFIQSIFEDASKLVSGDQYTTSSLVIPVICGLFENLNTIEISLETDVGKMFCSAIRRNMSSRLLAYETRTVSQISTYLHPTLRTGFRQPENMLSAKDRVRRELGSLILDSKNKTDAPSSDSIPTTGNSEARNFGLLKTKKE
ncbi:unnamed protein product [Parnassius apollo]|uniref:(apollo) hypothetical protein n=1 Tax=Parnassius apollo TaxID=110799 RepID=A0A8S3XGT3_PARAO|nr:unnamed protein product [Parnassius apollo]